MEGSNGGSPGSPKVSPVELSDCMEELVKFVLESSINGTLTMGSEPDLGLSSLFCSGLLQDDSGADDQYFPPSSDISEGVPPYPLYKRLASRLQQWIISGSFFSPSQTVPSISEDDSLKEMKDKWNDLVSEMGSQLVTVCSRKYIYVEEHPI